MLPNLCQVCKIGLKGNHHTLVMRNFDFTHVAAWAIQLHPSHLCPLKKSIIQGPNTRSSDELFTVAGERAQNSAIPSSILNLKSQKSAEFPWSNFVTLWPYCSLTLMISVCIFRLQKMMGATWHLNNLDVLSLQEHEPISSVPSRVPVKHQ